MTFEYEIGKKYTTFEISSFMACTVKREIVIKDKDDRGTIFALKGKRKRFYTKNPGKDMAVFEGWDLDLKADSDIVISNGDFITKSFSGNALLNFAGTPEHVKDWIENKQLNPELDKSIVVATTNPTKDEETFMVYPEHPNIENHAVARRLVEKQLLTA